MNTAMISFHSMASIPSVHGKQNPSPPSLWPWAAPSKMLCLFSREIPLAKATLSSGHAWPNGQIHVTCLQVWKKWVLYRHWSLCYSFNIHKESKIKIRWSIHVLRVLSKYTKVFCTVTILKKKNSPSFLADSSFLMLMEIELIFLHKESKTLDSELFLFASIICWFV
jgi:hypothetical protein